MHDENGGVFILSLEIIAWANDVLRRASPPKLEQGIEHLPAAFIVGPPRSGTTILHQILASRLRVGYVDNIVARFWECPFVGIAISNDIFSEEDRNYSTYGSKFGRTHHPQEPSEFGFFWTYWFGFQKDLPHTLSPQRREKVDIMGLRASMQTMQSAFGLPMLFKNVTCGLQADLVRAAYPNCFFIALERDLFDISRSILAARRSIGGSFGDWFSVRPRTWPDAVPKGGPADEVAWQVTETVRELRHALRTVDHIVVRYEDILSDPEAIVDRVAEAYATHGSPVARRSGEPLGPMRRKEPAVLPDALLDNLADRLDYYVG